MDMTKIESSSNIAEVGYDANSGKLRVRFISSGGLYEYDDVPKNVAEDFLLAESKGKYFHANIKNQHHARKVDETADASEAANDADSSLQEAEAVDQDDEKTSGKKRQSKSQQRRRRAQAEGNDDGDN